MTAKWLLSDAAGVLSYKLGPKGLASLSRPQMVQLANWISTFRRSSLNSEQHAELQAFFPKRSKRLYRHPIKEATRLRIFNELEVLRYPTLNPSNIHDVCDVLGLEHLDLALNKGRGAI